MAMHDKVVEAKRLYLSKLYDYVAPEQAAREALLETWPLLGCDDKGSPARNFAARMLRIAHRAEQRLGAFQPAEVSP